MRFSNAPTMAVYSVIVLMVVTVCSAQPSDWVVYPGEEWEAITPGEAGITDVAAWNRWVSTMKAKARGASFFGERHGDGEWGVAVCRGGYLLQTFGNPDYSFQTASVGKGFTSMALQLLVDKGMIKSIDDPVRDYWTGYNQLNSPHKYLDQGHHTTMTFRHLYEHVAGFPITNGHTWKASGKNYDKPAAAWAKCTRDPDYDNYSHTRPGSYPFSWDTYSSGGYWRLGQGITATWKQDMKAVLDEHLFSKMGIKAGEWDWISGKTVHDDKNWYPEMPDYGLMLDPPYEIDGQIVRGAPGWVIMNAKQMARVAHLVACRGWWKGQRLISDTKLVRFHAGGNGSNMSGSRSEILAVGQITASPRHIMPPKHLFAGPVAKQAATSRPDINVLSWRNGGSGHYHVNGPMPTKWSETSIRWKTALPHRSNASPILVDKRIFVCAEPDLLLCLAADTGNILWQRQTSYADLHQNSDFTKAVGIRLEQAKLSQLRRMDKDGLTLGHHPKMMLDPNDLPKRFQRPPVHRDAGFTTPTPVSDGQCVYVLYGTGLATCFSMDGIRQWCVYPDKPTIRWGQAASPIIVGRRLIIHTNDLIALDCQTGQKLWRTTARKRWATPATLHLPQFTAVVLGGGEIIHPADGRILADLFPHTERCDPYVNYWGASSPVVVGSTVYYVDATAVAKETSPTVQCFDIRLGSDGEVKAHRRWITDMPWGKYYASPVVNNDTCYVIASTLRTQGKRDYDSILNRRADGTLMAFNTETGTLLWAKALGCQTGTYHTCSLVGDRLWITGHRGIVVVLETSDDHNEVARIPFEATRSHPLIINQWAFYRGSEHLYCVGHTLPSE